MDKLLEDTLKLIHDSETVDRDTYHFKVNEFKDNLKTYGLDDQLLERVVELLGNKKFCIDCKNITIEAEYGNHGRCLYHDKCLLNKYNIACDKFEGEK